MAIYFDKETKTFFLEGRSVTYAFFINNVGYAEHLYFGDKIGRDCLMFTRGALRGSHEACVPGRMPMGIESYNKMGCELSFFGTGDFRECTVQVEREGGNRLCELTYAGHEILDEKPPIDGMPSMRGTRTLVLHLYDEKAGFGADLFYTVYDDCDVIARRIEYINCSGEDIRLHRAYSFAMTLPNDKYDIISLYGGWANERQIERTPLHHGVFDVNSKRACSSACLNPFISVVGRDTTEDFGTAYGFMLVYSSSFALKCEHTNGGDVLVTGGINDFDFTWTLADGEKFSTPEVIIAHSSSGIGGMSRTLHDALRNHLIPKKHRVAPRPIVINNWEATYFKFTTEKLCAIADASANLGIDTFVLDDGWFGVRDNDTSGLGDWVVNEEKLEGGLDAVISHLKGLGLKFGLWFEPEMISENSDVFRAHPDYAIGAPDRPRCKTRKQYAMDLTRADVRDYIVNSVNSILQNHDISYVKWDYNRCPTEFMSATLPRERQREFHHRYALGVYDLFERIVNANPDVFFEGCASGGARFDAGVLAYFPQIWTSDNSDVHMRTAIQRGTSIAYPISASTCHISAVPNHQTGRTTPFTSRQHIASLGPTGYELDMTKITDEERELVKKHTEWYRGIEELILTGDVYRDSYRTDSNVSSVTVVAKDKSQAVTVCYRALNLINTSLVRIRPRGLSASKSYYCPELALTLSGSTLLNVGIMPSFANCDFATLVYHFEEK
ncbi:MAG: alpha-galactosidase [Clostridia bacterium]|nr:alpha-galactosidase [Clostridia bacterium]